MDRRWGRANPYRDPLGVLFHTIYDGVAMTMRLYNTLTRQKELFEPLQPGKVGIYLCGPTVYKPSHLGHAVGPIIFDVLKRYLTFKGYSVRLIVNVTDVDDKLIVEAREQQTTVPELARRIESLYLDAMKKLRIRGIDAMPRASENIPEIIASIQRLIDRGHAYAADGNVYFDVSTDGDYGKLSNRNPEELLAGTRDALVETGKRRPGDFALWKAAKPDEPREVVYDSPWGPGRPGWHIECSAMSAKFLGETFDIHGGGLDLVFPHHENEIAQSECMTGRPFARFWLHNGLTRMKTKERPDAEPEKISKSLGVQERLLLMNLIDELGPELVRYMVISSHYRSPLDFSDETIAAARKGLQTFYRMFERFRRITGRDAYQVNTQLEQARQAAGADAARKLLDEMFAHQLEFVRVMDDDLNTAGALGVLYEMAGCVNRFVEVAGLEDSADADSCSVLEGAVGSILGHGRLLGLFEEPPPAARGGDDELSEGLIRLLIDARQKARQLRQFELADFIRTRMADLGVTLEDRPGGTEWRRE